MWHTVVNTDTYYDKDEGKLRDIAIVAWDFLSSKKVRPISQRTGLVIECKKDENFAWVFFSRPFEFEMDNIDGQYVDEVQCITKNTENYQIMETIYEKASFHYENIARIAVSYDAFYLTGKKTSFNKKKREIFEAQNQVKKYINYTIEQLIKASPRLDVYLIDMYFPCIIFDGLMYEAILEKGKLKLEESNHIVLSSSYRSPYSIFEKGILIDVVRKSYFKDYQRLIREDVTSLRRIVRGNAKKFARKIEEVGSMVSSARAKD